MKAVNRARFRTLPAPRSQNAEPQLSEVSVLLAVPKWAIFAITAMFSLVLLSASIFNILPTHSTITARFSQVIFLLSPLITFLGYGKLRVPVQTPKSVIMLFGLQAWLTICTFLAFTQFGRTSPSDESDFIFLMYGLVFMAGAIGSFYAPTVRKIAFGLIIAIAVLNCFVAALQFVHFGPALTLAKMNSVQDITNWDGIKGAVRLVGLQNLPENLAIFCIMANGVFLGKLLTRKLNPLEYFCSALFLGIAFAAQSRVMYLTLLISVIVEFALVIWHDRKAGLLMFAIGGLLLGVIGVKAGDKLAYGLRLSSNDPSFVYRREVAWPQAYRILEARPGVGIGIETRLTTSAIRGDTDTSRWCDGISLDNGVLLMGAWGGYPAIGIFAIFVLLASGGLLGVCASRQATETRKVAAAVALAGFLAMLNNAFLNNTVLNWRQVLWICLTAGMAMPAVDEFKQSAIKIRERFRPLGDAKSPNV